MNKIAPYLTYLGLIPFILLGFYGKNLTPPSFEALNLYAVVIISFLAGSHWGIAVKSESLSSILVHSNILALLTCAHAIDKTFSAVILCSLLLYALFIDNLLYQKEKITQQYLQMRINITLAVSFVILFLSLY